jgi:hypothetical protein
MLHEITISGTTGTPPYDVYVCGIRIKAGKNERLVLKIRDNLNLTLTQLSTFDGRVYGYKKII